MTQKKKAKTPEEKKARYQEACDKIEYYLKSPEVGDEERKNALRAYYEYELLYKDPVKRPKRYGMMWSVEKIMGYKEKWEL